MTIRYTTEAIGAKRALDLLSRNTNNRNIAQNRVGAYAEDMVAQRWPLTAEPIQITTDNVLIDGQHRLNAVILADARCPGIQVPFTVAWDVPRSTFTVIDQGKVRSAADILKIEGITDGTTIGSAARLVLAYERAPGKVWSSNDPRTSPSKKEATDFASEHYHEFVVIEPHAAPVYRTTAIKKAVWTAFAWLVARGSTVYNQPFNTDADDDTTVWEAFRDGVITGADLRTGDARLALRNWRPGPGSTWGSGQGHLGCVIKSWNFFVADKPVQALRYRRDELPMPKVQ